MWGARRRTQGCKQRRQLRPARDGRHQRQARPDARRRLPAPRAAGCGHTGIVTRPATCSCAVKESTGGSGWATRTTGDADAGGAGGV